MGLVDDLAKLAELHSTGALSDTEYAAAKTRLIEGVPSAAEVRPVVEKSMPVETAKDPDTPPKLESPYVWDGVQRGGVTAKDPDAPPKRTPAEEKRPDKRKNEDNNHQQGCCPCCGASVVPTTKSRISTQGWIVFAFLSMFCSAGNLLYSLLCFALSLLAILINREECRVCSECGGYTPLTPRWVGVALILFALLPIASALNIVVGFPHEPNILKVVMVGVIGPLGAAMIVRGIRILSAPSKVLPNTPNSEFGGTTRRASSSMKNAIATCLILAGIGLVAYLYLRSEAQTINRGVVAAKIMKSEKADQMGDESLQKDEHLKKIVSELMEPVFRDLGARYGVGKPYSENYHFKKKGQHFRIMGSAPRGSKETVIFVIVLREGKQVFIEVGDLYTDGRYPDGVF